MIHLRHPGVVNLLDLFCEGGAAFLVLEHMQVLAARTLIRAFPGHTIAVIRHSRVPWLYPDLAAASCLNLYPRASVHFFKSSLWVTLGGKGA